MNRKPQIIAILILLLALPDGFVLACGTSKDMPKAASGINLEMENHSNKKACCNADENQNSDNHGCEGNCNHGYCHCPVSVNVLVVLNRFEFQINTNFSPLEYDWAYIQDSPKSVYLTIWQPPKIS